MGEGLTCYAATSWQASSNSSYTITFTFELMAMALNNPRRLICY